MACFASARREAERDRTRFDYRREQGVSSLPNPGSAESGIQVCRCRIPTSMGGGQVKVAVFL